MNASAEFGDRLNQIGVEAIGTVGDEDAKILIYADMADDSDEIIFLAARSGEDRLRTPDDVLPVADALRAAWTYSRGLGPEHRWVAIAYRIEDRKMSVELFYDGDVPADEGIFEKQDRLVAKYFPGMDAE